jgi:sortase A
MTLRIETHVGPPPDSFPDRAFPQTQSSSRRVRSKPNWFVRWTAPLILFLVGCFALGYYAYSILDAHFFQSDESRQFDQALQDARAANAAAVAPNRTPAEDLRAEAEADLKASKARAAGKGISNAASAASSSTSPALPDVDDVPAANHRTPPPGGSSGPLGRIEIAAIGLTAMIQEGTAPLTLQRGVGHITGTAPVGHSGNVGLAAHRDTFFRKLRDIHQGDEITLTTLAGTFLYKVDHISIVEPQASEVLRNSGENVLTLVTCYPFSYIGPAPKRFIVRATQIKPS